MLRKIFLSFAFVGLAAAWISQGQTGLAKSDSIRVDRTLFGRTPMVQHSGCYNNSDCNWQAGWACLWLYSAGQEGQCVYAP